LGTSPMCHGAACMYACVCWVERWRENARERERKREIQPSFSPLGTTGANSMAFLFFRRSICVYVCLGRGWVGVV
jgi:hypothetical protein